MGVPMVKAADRIEQLLDTVGDGTGTTEMITNAAITAASNATPIVVTSNGHGLATGDQVTILNVEGNLVANGNHTVTYVDVNNFSLNGTVGTDNYTANGEWWENRFMCAPAATVRYVLEKLRIYIEDNTEFEGNLYAAAAALTNGIVLSVQNASGTVKTLTPNAVKKTFHWGLVAGSKIWMRSPTAAQETVAVIEIDLGGLPLKGEDGEFLQMLITDCLGNDGQALVSQVAQVSGRVTTAALEYA